MDPATRPVRDTDTDDEIHLKDAWYLLVRSRLLIGATILAGGAATAVYNHRAADVFDAVTSISLSEDRTEAPMLGFLRTLSTGSQVETEMEVLRSRTLVEEVVDSLAVQLRLVAPRGVARSYLLDAVSVQRDAPPGRYMLERRVDGSFSVPETPGVAFRLRPQAAEYDRITLEIIGFENAVEDLQRRILVVRPNRDADIVTVHYQSPDTQLVHDIPNALASVFIARRKAVRKTEVTSTVRFLEEQLDTMERQLAVAEAALTAFREREQIVSIHTEAESQVAQLARLQADRNVLDTERAALRGLMTDVDEQAAAADTAGSSPYVRLLSFPALYGNWATSELLRGLNEAYAQRSRLLERRTMRDPDVMNLTDRIRELEAQLHTTATTYLEGLTNQVAAYDRTLARFGSQLERIPAREVQLARLQRRTQVLGDLYTLLQQRLQESRILEGIDDASVRVVDRAILPSEPLRPERLLNLIMGLMLGGMLGVSGAFAREYLDESIHVREEMRRSTGGAPVLGMIPRIPGGNGNGFLPRASSPPGPGVRLVAGRDRDDPVSEAYKTLRTNLMFSARSGPPKSVVFTSPLPREGKSTSAANLGITLAQQGMRVLLVDADLRRGILHSVFGVAREPGLTELIAGRAAATEAILDVYSGDSGRLHLLPSGPFPPNPAEVLGSSEMTSLVQSLEDSFDIVILDSAPLAVVIDAAVLGTSTDGVVLVARSSRTEKNAVAYAVAQLRQVGARVLGSVLNDVDPRRDSRTRTGYVSQGSYPPARGTEFGG